VIPSLFECATQHWSAGLGDPHLMGWVTVGVYALAAVLTARRAIVGQFPAESRKRERLFWALSAILLGLLAVNKQLDLQTLLTEMGRCAARAQGWYEDRQIVQRWFIMGVIVAGTVLVGWLALVMRRTLRRTGLAVLGLGLVCTFVAVRAAGFHNVDILIGTEVAGLRMNWLLELPGPTLVAIAALRGSMPN